MPYIFLRGKKKYWMRREEKMYLLQKTKIKYSDDGQRWTIMEKKKFEACVI